jgi:hypothetical protein
VVRGVASIDFGRYGIALQSNCFACTLQANLTVGNGSAGTFVGETHESRGGLFAPNHIIGCYSYAEDGNGFGFQGSICQNMVGCVSYLASGHGIYMKDSTSNLISGCRVFMCFKNGMFMDDTYEVNISSSICGWNWWHNLEMNHAVWGVVSANEFIDAGGRGMFEESDGPELEQRTMGSVAEGGEPYQRHGIYLHSGTRGLQVSGNAIFNWWGNQPMDCGIVETEDCEENQISENSINYYKDAGVKAEGAGTRVDANLEVQRPYHFPQVDRGLPPLDVPQRFDSTFVDTYTTKRADYERLLERYDHQKSILITGQMRSPRRSAEELRTELRKSLFGRR